MHTLHIKSIKDKHIVELLPAPMSSFALFFYFISLLLLSSIVYIFLGFRPNIIKALAFAFIPIALFIFNLKVNIWNMFGKETLVIDYLKILSTLDYSYVFKKKTTEHLIGGGNLYVQSSKDGSKRKLSDSIPSDHSQSKFRLLLIDQGETIYQSSNFIDYNEVAQLRSSLKPYLDFYGSPIEDNLPD